MCCGPYHGGGSVPTPLALMRSRYSAYAMGKADYIIDTTHPALKKHQPPVSRWREEILKFCQGTTFEGLDIMQVEEGDEAGFVTFKARLSKNGKDLSFIEKSRFEKEGGRWLYHSRLDYP